MGLWVFRVMDSKGWYTTADQWRLFLPWTHLEISFAPIPSRENGFHSPFIKFSREANARFLYCFILLSPASSELLEVTLELPITGLFRGRTSSPPSHHWHRQVSFIRQAVLGSWMITEVTREMESSPSSAMNLPCAQRQVTACLWLCICTFFVDIQVYIFWLDYHVRWEWVTDSGKVVFHKQGDDSELTRVWKPCILVCRAFYRVSALLSYSETYSLIKTFNRFLWISRELGKGTMQGTVWRSFLLVAWLPITAA